MADEDPQNQAEIAALAATLDKKRRQAAHFLGVADIGPPPVEDDTHTDEEEQS